MHIQKVIIKNFRCFEHLEVNLDPDINIFVGNNGSGKSALLDGIAAAIFVYYVRCIQLLKDIKYQEQHSRYFSDEDFPVKQYNKQETQTEFTVSTTDLPESMIVYEISNQEDIRVKIQGIPPSEEADKKLLSEMQHKCDILTSDPKSELSVIAYYKGDRNFLTNIANIDSIANKLFDRFDALNNAFHATANFTDVTTWFFMREYEELREGKNRRDINFELPDLKQIRKAISTIIAPNARIYFSGANNAKLMVEWEMETGEKRELLLSQLSAGYRNMLALVMDFARRLAQANPQMENPLEAEAILMIDELDLHLHPTWQQKIIPDLKKVFPNTQIIATTHSPEVVTTVKQNQVKILEDYQIKECPSPTKGMKKHDNNGFTSNFI